MATKQITATLGYSDGSTEDVTTSATWTSSDDAVATVAAGLITAVAEGACTVTADAEGVSGECAVTVPAPTVEGMTVEPTSTTVEAE